MPRPRSRPATSWRSSAALDQIAFVAQDAPLYKNLSVADVLHLTEWISYQPESRFWHFQLIEGGWLLALAVPLGRRPSGWSGTARRDRAHRLTGLSHRRVT